MALITIQRKLTLKHKEYYGNGTLMGYSHYTRGFFPIKLIVFWNGKPKYIMRESSYLRWFFRMIPIVGIFLHRSFAILDYNTGEIVGKSTDNWWKPAVSYTIYGDIYHLNIHRDERFSLTKNEIQIALFKKTEETWNEKNTYSVYFSNDTSIQIILLFTIFIDIFYFDNDGMSFTVEKKTKILVLHDPHPEYADWRPEGWNIGNPPAP